MTKRLHGEITPNNTKVSMGETTSVKLHNTVVVSFDDVTVTLDSGGWQTVTTKRRMNETSKAFGLDFGVYQKDHEWYVTHRGVTLDFYDGMTLDRRSA